MTRTLFFDLDGTIADLYGVADWLEDLINHNPRPYKEAKVMVNMSLLARLLNRLQANGYRVGVISWLSKNSTTEYDEEVTQAKLEWLSRHLNSVGFDEINIVAYGTPKSNFATKNDILFDDEIANRENWIGSAFPPNEIISTLKTLASSL